MLISQRITISQNIIELFQKRNYEKLVLSIMNSSIVIFPEEYEPVKNQSHGECDYIGKTTKTKFDAKLPFFPEQIELLTNGKKHSPQIHKWLEEVQNETVEFNPLIFREDPTYNVKNTRLFKIIQKAVERDKPDENIVFFFPFPVVPTLHDTVFLDKTSNFLTMIYDLLKTEFDFSQRTIYVIHPSLKMNCLALRNLNTRTIEYLKCSELEQYISFEIVDFSVDS